MLWVCCKDCPEFKSFFSSKLNGQRLKLVVYSDEVTPGRELLKYNRKKFWVFYWSFLDFGPAALANEDAWFTGLTLRSITVKKLAGGFTDEAWPSVDYATVDGCHGHKAGDVIPFRFSLKTQSSLSDGSSDPNSAVPNNQTKYTNEELYNYMASGSPDMPYVYQDFNWDHCNSVALNTSYDFAGLVTSWQQSTGLPNARA